MLERQALIILQKIILRLILITLIKIAHLTGAPLALVIQHQLLQEVVQAVALLVAADLLAAAEQEVAAAINHAKKINAGLNDISII